MMAALSYSLLERIIRAWGTFPRVYQGGKKVRRPIPCRKCAGRYRHRKPDCDGVITEYA